MCVCYVMTEWILLCPFIRASRLLVFFFARQAISLPCIVLPSSFLQSPFSMRVLVLPSPPSSLLPPHLRFCFCSRSCSTSSVLSTTKR